ncbi:MAG: sensor histidine kinase [Christensenellales bacterium]|jgi:two-component system sensor histidine kinase YesM
MKCNKVIKNLSSLKNSGFSFNIGVSDLFIFFLFLFANITLVLASLFSQSFILTLYTVIFAIIANLVFFHNLFKIVASYIELSARSASAINNMKSNNERIAKDIDTDSLIISIERILNYLDSVLEQEYSAKLLQKQAEFESIVNQINPHFLYNSLDSIRGYAVLENALKSADMIETLSRIFRYTISQSSIISLEQEINNATDYIKLQQYRFGRQFSFIKQIECDRDFLLSFQVPKFILQPIVENAIKHGLSTMKDDSLIKLKIYTTMSRVIISVFDNGCGMEAEALNSLNKKLLENKYHNVESKGGIGVGLWNVNARIKLLFGNEYGINIFSMPSVGSEFQIILPLIEVANVS